MEKALKISLRILGIIALICMIGATLVVAAAASYSVMTADDFWFAQDTGRFVNWGQYIVACWNRTVNEYLHWQGTYFSEFISALFNPVNVGGLTAMRPIMIINALLTVVSAAVFAFLLMSSIDNEWYFVKFLILACILFVILEYNVFPEIFFWYTGSVVNSLPLSLGFISLSLFLLSNQKESRLFTVISIILGFLSVGGSLAVSGTLCYGLLILILYYSIRDKKIRPENIAVFASFFIGSLINAAAPGNFERQAISSQESFGLLDAVISTWKYVTGEIGYMFHAYNFAVILILFTAMGIILAGRSSICKKAWYISSAAALLTPFVTVFPVVLGYKLTWIPNRCMFIFYTVIAFTAGSFFLTVGSLIGSALKNARYPASTALLAAACVLALLSSFEPRSYRTVRIVKGLMDGKYQTSYDETKELFDYFSQNQGKDLVVDTNITPDDIEYYYCFHLMPDPNDRVNKGVAWTFNLNSVSNSR